MKRLIVLMTALLMVGGLAKGQDITIVKQTVHYKVDLSLDSAATRWTVQPQTGTIARTGEKTAVADLLAGTYEITAWSRPRIGTTLEITVGDTPPVPPSSLIQSFTVVPDTVEKGASSVIAWSAPTAKSGAMNGIPVGTTGSQSVVPDATTTYTLSVSDGIKTESAQRILTVTDKPPPTPVPPGPVPPIPTTKLNVAFIVPTPDAPRILTPDQAAMVQSKTLRDYLDATCDKDDDGKTPARKVLYRSLPPDQLTPRWKSVLDKTPKDGFVIAAVNGSKFTIMGPGGTEPFPTDTAGLLASLAKVSGVAAPKIVPSDFPKLRIIPDKVWDEVYNPPSKVAMVGGEQRFLTLAPRDLTKHPRGKTLAAFGINVIPRSEWQTRVDALTKANAGLMPLTYIILPYDQDGTNYCWCNGPCQGFTAQAYLQGRTLYRISAASVGGPVTNYRNVGGMGGDAMDFLASTGGVNELYWPSNEIKSADNKKPEVIADRPRNLLTTQLADLGSTGKMFDEVATCVLLGNPCPVGYNWWGHEVLAVGLTQKGGTWYLILRNSWGEYEDHGFFLLPEGSGRNKGTPDDAQAILSVEQASFRPIRAIRRLFNHHPDSTMAA